MDKNRLYCGGNWDDRGEFSQASSHVWFSPMGHMPHIGFRLVRVPAGARNDEAKPAVDPKVVRGGPPPELAELRKVVEQTARRGEKVDEIRRQLDKLEKALGVRQPELPKPKDGPLGMKFVPLPKATFYMGWGKDVKPSGARKTEIKEDFEVAVHELTQGQWQEVMGNNPSWFSRTGIGDGKHVVKDIPDEDLKQFPVEYVRWTEVKAFIKKLNEQERGKGYLYRLPSEAEWEYACRGGATTEDECSYYFYLTKPTNDLSSDEANFEGEKPFGKAQEGPYLDRPTKVGSYPPNQLGLYDMHGNVFEWCEDLFFPGTNDYENVRVFKGGDWNQHGHQQLAGLRHGKSGVGKPVSGLGFRLVRVPARAQDK